MSDLGIFEAGDPIPEEWVDLSPKDGLPMTCGEITFCARTEVTFKDGWLRLHVIEPLPDQCMLRMSGTWRNVMMHFCNDMQFFDEDGRQFGGIMYCPDGRIDIG